METARTDLLPLARRLANDRDDAFPDLVRALQDGIFSGMLRMTGNRGEAEELTQEAFVRAYRALGGYPTAQVQELRLRPWMWTIALNLSRNLARSKKRRPRTSPLDTAPEPASGDSTEDVALSSVDDAWQVRLQRLSAPVRQAVVLRHVVGLGYAEIAEALDRPTGTVKSDVHRGVDRLRKILADEGGSL